MGLERIRREREREIKRWMRVMHEARANIEVENTASTDDLIVESGMIIKDGVV